MAPARVLIAGAGPAGLTLASALHRRGCAVAVYERQHRRPDRGLGLWGRSQVVLRDLGLANLLDDCHRIPAAAYRSRDGAWLSRSSDTPANRVRVATLRESALLASLETSEDEDARKMTAGGELSGLHSRSRHGDACVRAGGVRRGRARPRCASSSPARGPVTFSPRLRPRLSCAIAAQEMAAGNDCRRRRR